MKALTLLQVEEIVGLRKAGLTIKIIARALELSPETVKGVCAGRSHSKETGITKENQAEFFGVGHTQCTACSRPIVRGRFCAMHYNRSKKYGDPLMKRTSRYAKKAIIQEVV